MAAGGDEPAIAAEEGSEDSGDWAASDAPDKRLSGKTASIERRVRMAGHSFSRSPDGGYFSSAPVISATRWKNAFLRALLMLQFAGTLW